MTKQADVTETATSPIEVAPRLLVIDDEANMRDMLSRLLTRSGYAVETAADGREGLQCIDDADYDFILCDLKMPGVSGIEFLKAGRPRLRFTTVIMMSAYGTIDTAIEAMKHGAYDYISKPFKIDEVILTLRKAEERENLRKENRYLKEKIRRIESSGTFGNMVAKNKAMLDIFRLAEKVAQYDTTVMIYGESGTGKELVARGIHHHSGRARNLLYPVNCGGIPESLLESEFFGYKKGAFTGADQNKKGIFEEAEGGTVFLDEIGELPLPLQVKLLRVLQENEIRPLGSTRTRKVNVRVIAATSKNLEEEVQNGNFREDLYYRLNVLTIKIPPLKDRLDDIPMLSHHFIDKLNERLSTDIKGIAPAALTMLMKHDWPGNVRELENVIERAAVLGEKGVLLPENLPSQLGSKPYKRRLDDFFEGFSLKRAQKIMEERLIKRALEATGGNRTKATELLEISHPSLLSKMKTYGIDM